MLFFFSTSLLHPSCYLLYLLCIYSDFDVATCNMFFFYFLFTHILLFNLVIYYTYSHISALRPLRATTNTFAVWCFLYYLSALLPQTMRALVHLYTETSRPLYVTCKYNIHSLCYLRIPADFTQFAIAIFLQALIVFLVSFGITGKFYSGYYYE